MADSINYALTAFLKSAPTLRDCPPDSGAEVAFAGRSNAGKSSAINALTRQTKLARTSKTPGRTQLINFFALSEQQRLVDLPGYGFAKVPLEVKRRWEQHLEEYLRYRRCLRGLVLLMDIRHPLQAFDATMIDWAAQSEMPVRVLLTKADKLKFGAAKNTLLKVRKSLLPYGELVQAQLFSAQTGQGVDDLKEQLDIWLAADGDTEQESEQGTEGG